MPACVCMVDSSFRPIQPPPNIAHTQILHRLHTHPKIQQLHAPNINHSALGIPVVAPLPSVGKGLKDHLLAPVCGFSRVNMR